MEESCRLCLSGKDVLIPIFYEGSALPTNILSCLAVQVSPDDNHKRICTMCDKKLRQWWDFKLEVQSAQKFLNLQKQLYSKTVTSSGENQNLSDVSGSSTPRSDNTSRPEGSSSFSASGIKQENLSDSKKRSSSNRKSIPPSIPADSNSYYVSSSSSGSTSGRESAASSNTAKRTNSLRSNDDDDCVVVDQPPKRKAPVVTLDKSGNKKQKKAATPSKMTKKNSEPGKPTPSQTHEQSQEVDTGEPLKCHYCTSTFSNRMLLNSHLKYHSVNRRFGKKHIKCPYCPIVLQVYSLRGHVRNVHKMDPDAAGILTYIETKFTKGAKATVIAEGMKMVVFPCNLCKNSYKNPMALKVHKNKFHGNRATSNLLKVKPALHVKKNTTCDKCNRRLLSVKAVAIHKQYCGTERASSCPFCQKQFESVQRLRRHISEKHSGGPKDEGEHSSANSTSKVSASRVPSGNPPQCEPAPSSVQKQAAKGVPKHQCQQCTRIFHSATGVDEHLKYCGGPQAVKCRLCPYQYNSPRSCNIHSANTHQKVVIPCDFCNRKFSSKADYYQHQKIHKQSLKSKMLHKCRSCQNVYTGLKSFNNHKTNCRLAFEYKCEKCFLHFQDENSLHNHVPQCVGKSRFEEKLQLLHKSIKCLQCTKKFSSENHFINHFVESHVNATNSIFSGVNMHDCHSCFYAANNPESLRRHGGQCRGIPFYVVKSALQKSDLPSVQDDSGSFNSQQNPEENLHSGTRNSDLNKPSCSTSSDMNIEITKICSPAFMNEHLNASKSAQVVVEKLSEKQIHRTSIESIKSEPKVGFSPRDKVQCEFCKRFFTPTGFPTHRCHKRKKILAQRARQKSQETKEVAAASTLIKCEMCFEMIAQENLVEHCKSVHHAIRPEEMAQGMITVHQHKQAIEQNMKLEKYLADLAASHSVRKSTSRPDTSPQESGDEDAAGSDDKHHSAGATTLIKCDMCLEMIAEEDLIEHCKTVHHAIKPEVMAQNLINVHQQNMRLENYLDDPEASHSVSKSTTPLDTSPQESDKEDAAGEYDEHHGDESFEDPILIECDICNAHFTATELEVHLRDQHNAVNPAALAKTMGENNIAKINVQSIKTEHEMSPDEETSSPENSPDGAENVHSDQEEDEENDEGEDIEGVVDNVEQLQDEEDFSFAEEEEDRSEERVDTLPLESIFLGDDVESSLTSNIDLPTDFGRT
ncbi:unnamed protein product [Bemisia tabaci]|uniref:Uncharacterized protein n=1 Tax=Bemisia tabaci TaxID=7038 RepID=A0A9P0F6V9_BEMTA|nr:unnamed protein product [Bemisia tabaci]